MKKFALIFVIILSLFILHALPFSISRADQTISVSGSVPPQASDFQLSVKNDATGTIPQNTTVTYTITYGSNLYHSDNIKLEAQWYQGTISGGGTVSPMDYVTGSAGNAYNNTSPIIDLSNNKIDWNISTFPSQTTNQTVTFQLRTNTAYTGTSTVDFPVKVRMYATDFTTSDQTTDINYQYNNSSVTPTPTPTSGPTNTPTPGPTSTPTPTNLPGTPTPTPLIPTPTPVKTFVHVISDVSIFNLNSNEADISMITTQVGTVSILFGNSPSDLNHQESQLTNGSTIFSLINLLPKTTYYFQVDLQSSTGKYTSEIYSLTTPAVSQIPEVVKTSVVIASAIDVLFSAGLSQNGQNPTQDINKIPVISIPTQIQYSIAFKITKTINIKSVQILLQSSNVLGLKTPAFAQERTLSSYPYIYSAYNKGNGIYSATITNTLPPGNYNMFLVIKDTNGNITTEKIAIVHILHPFGAINAKTDIGIEDVRIVLYRQNSATNDYSILSESGIQNPIYTDSTGQASEQLITGKYKAVFQEIGYVGQTKIFTLGTNSKDDYPTVYLQPTAITPLTIFTYYKNAFIDFLALLNAYIIVLHASNRFFDLFGLLLIFCFIILSFLIFRIRSHIAFSHMPYYLHHHTLNLFGKSTYIHGKVVDGINKQPVSDASVILIDELSKQVIKFSKTNKIGEFVIPGSSKNRFTLTVVKEGYEEISHSGYSPNMVIYLPKTGEPFKRSVVKLTLEILEESLSLFFEFILVVSLIFEFIFFPVFGLTRTLPGLTISIINVLLWIFYIREKGKQIP